MVSMLQVRDIELKLRLQQRSQPSVNIDGVRRLLGLPVIHSDEVFSSWIVRMMLSRKMKKRKVLDEIGLKNFFYLADLKPTSFNLSQLVQRFNLIQVGLLERSFIYFDIPMKDSLCLTTDIFNRTPIFRFCPFCIGEKPYIRKSWRYAFTYACPEHECLLLERCSECGQFLSFEKLNITKLDNLSIHNLGSCVSCGAALSSQRSSVVAERTMIKILDRQKSMSLELSGAVKIKDYIAQIRYSEDGIVNYLNVGVSGALIFKEDADEIRTAFQKAGVFSTTYWQTAGCISIKSNIGKVKRAKQWVVKQRGSTEVI